MNKLAVTAIAIMLSACSSQPEQLTIEVTTLASLQPAYVPAMSRKLPSANLDELRELYLQALKASNDRHVNRQVKKRLASIEMQRSENSLADSFSDEKQLFVAVISAYEDLLTETVEGEPVDNYKYQLARAYEMNGQQEKSLTILSQLVQEHGESDRYVESEFRLAESAFSVGQYIQASTRYKNVINRGESIYSQNSTYMMAWSYFKSNRYIDAIETYVQSLDLFLRNEESEQRLDKGAQQIVDDSFRMLSVSFSTLEGVETLNGTLNDLGEKPYSSRLFKSLAKYYLGLQRYRDSADTYQAFVDRYPRADQRYRYQNAKIEVFKKGGFRQEVLDSKVEFLAGNDIDAEYWQSRTHAVQDDISEYLRTYMIELSGYYHSLAQQIEIDTTKANKNALKERENYYQKAIFYYSRFVNSFPRHERAAEMLFLLAEAQYETEDYPSAIHSYEGVAYQYQDSPKAVEAGYAAIIAYDKLPLPKSSNKQALAKAEKIISNARVTSSLRFTKAFPTDKRSPAIQLNAAQTLMGLSEFARAIVVARKLLPGNELNLSIAKAAGIEKSIVVSAWLVVAQSAFDLADYFYAETSYSETIKLLDKKDKRVKSLVDRYAASIYKQGEMAVASQQHGLAAQHFSRVISEAPKSSIRLNAQFDAANSYYQIKDWPNALNLYIDFRQRYPQHKLTKGLGATLALIYQETQAWELAARELLAVYENEKNDTKKAQLLYLTAELFEKAENKQQAILYYRTYAHGYKVPFDINFESMNKLSELYLQLGEDSKRRFWLKKMIMADASAKQSRTNRTTFLAAMASSVFADDAYRAFNSIKLSLPLKKSLKRKKKSLELVLKRYKATAKYGVSEYTTLSLYRLGEVYGQLSRDLIASERPASLDELALEQYEILLEEQAYPFEEKAIEIHEQNVENSWKLIYDDGVKDSFKSLATLLPARYKKEEVIAVVDEGIY
jgi:TolA-binding protein